jgi:hypothetical protein
MRFPFLICTSLPLLGLLPLLLLPRLPTVMVMFPFHDAHIILLWFHVTVTLRILPCAPAYLAFAPLHFPYYCLPSTYLAGWRPMPPRVCLIPICFSFFFFNTTTLGE